MFSSYYWRRLILLLDIIIIMDIYFIMNVHDIDFNSAPFNPLRVFLRWRLNVKSLPD